MVSSYNLGAVRTTDDANIKIFGFTYQESDDYTPFELGGVDYQVPTSKQLVVSVITIKSSWTTSNNLAMGYADDTTGTNWVQLVNEGAIQPVSATYHSCELPLIVPASKYPLIKQIQAGQGIYGSAAGLLETV